MTDAGAVARHYTPEDPVTRTRDALVAAGLGEGPLAWDALARLDQFHTGGLGMTERLALRLELDATCQVVDLGAGVGGPARFLAARYLCQVRGFDLTPGFVELARYLSWRTRLDSQTTFEVGDVTDLPLASASVDRVLCQHVAMNIRRRDRLYAEAFRVLRPGGLVGFHDVIQGGQGALRYPVPWAATANESLLLTAEETCSAVTRAGFTEAWVVDVTADTVAGARPAPAPGDAAAPGPDLAFLLGPGFAERAQNLHWNLREGRARIIQLVGRRPA